MKHNEKTVTYSQIEAMRNISFEEWLKKQDICYKCKELNCEHLEANFYVAEIYTLVCKEKPLWAEWMREHFTDEALGVVPPKEEFCNCIVMRVQKEKGAIRWNEYNDGSGGNWFCDSLSHSTGKEALLYCYHCGKKLAPPKPPEQTFNLKDKLIVSGEGDDMNPMQIIAIHSNNIALLMKNGHCYHGISTPVKDCGAFYNNIGNITEAELRQIIGNSQFEKVEKE